VYIKMSRAPIIITSNTTLDPDYTIYLVNAASGNISITLPAFSTIGNVYFKLKRIDTSSNTVTISSINSGTEKIDGNTSINLNVGDKYGITSYNSSWYTVDSGSESNSWANTEFVDLVTGSDTTGKRGREDLPFLSISAAIAASQAGDTVYLRPGIYTGSTGFIVTAGGNIPTISTGASGPTGTLLTGGGIAIIGQDASNCVVNLIPAGNTTMFSLYANSRLSNLTANLGGNTTAYNLNGIAFLGVGNFASFADSLATATVTNVSMNVDDSGATLGGGIGTAGTSTLNGVFVNCNQVTAVQTLINMDSSTILVNSIGYGNKRGLLVSTGGFVSQYNTIVSNAKGLATGGAGTGTYIGVEVNQTSGAAISYYLGRKGYIQGTSNNFQGATGADISQTTPVGINNNGAGIMLDNEALYSGNANGLTFTSLAGTSQLIWGAIGVLATGNRPAFVLFGQQSTFVTSTVEQHAQIGFFRPTNVKNLRVYAATANASNIFTIRKNGVDTTLAVTAVAGTVQTDTTHSVFFGVNDVLSLQLADTGDVIGNIVVTVELY
jgi:hypothetical protein